MTGGGGVVCEKSNTVEILNLKNFPKTIQEKSKSDSHDFEMKWILVKRFTFPIERLMCYRSLSLNGSFKIGKHKSDFFDSQILTHGYDLIFFCLQHIVIQV